MSEFHQCYGRVSLPTRKHYQACLEEKRWWPFLQDGLPNKLLGGFYSSLAISAPSCQQSWGVTVRVLSGKRMPCRIFKWRVFNTSNWFQGCWKLKEQKEGLNIIITRGSSYNSQGRGKQRGHLWSPGPWSREEEACITGVWSRGESCGWQSGFRGRGFSRHSYHRRCSHGPMTEPINKEDPQGWI